MNGSQYSTKIKKLVTKQYYKKLFVFFYTLTKGFWKFLNARDLQSVPKTSNEGLEISYTMPDLFVLPRFQGAWWDKKLVKNFHKYTVFLKNCVNLVSFSLWINTIQYFTKDWNSLILTLFDGKKEGIRVRNFHLT